MPNQILLNIARQLDFKVTENSVYGIYEGNLLSIYNSGPIYIIYLNVKNLSADEVSTIVKSLKNLKLRGLQSIKVDEIFSCIVINLHINLIKKLGIEILDIFKNISSITGIKMNTEEYALCSNFPIFLDDISIIESNFRSKSQPLLKRVAITLLAAILLNLVLIFFSFNPVILKFIGLVQIVFFIHIVAKFYLSKIYKPTTSLIVEIFSLIITTFLYLVFSVFTQAYIAISKTYEFNLQTSTDYLSNNFTAAVLPLGGFLSIFLVVGIFSITKSLKGIKIVSEIKPENQYENYQLIKDKFNKKYVPIFLVSWFLLSILSVFFSIKKAADDGHNFVNMTPLFIADVIVFLVFLIFLWIYFNSFNRLDPEYETNKSKSITLNFVVACFGSFLISVTGFIWIMYINVHWDMQDSVFKVGYVEEQIDNVVKVDTCYKIFSENGDYLESNLCEKKIGIVTGREKIQYLHKEGFFKTGIVFTNHLIGHETWDELVANKISIKNIGFSSINNLLKIKSEEKFIRESLVPSWTKKCKTDGAACRMLAYVSFFDGKRIEQNEFNKKGCNLSDANSCIDLLYYMPDDKSLMLKSSKLLFEECQKGFIRSCKIFYRHFENSSDEVIIRYLNEVLNLECNRKNEEACDRQQWLRNKIG